MTSRLSPESFDPANSGLPAPCVARTVSAPEIVAAKCPRFAQMLTELEQLAKAALQQND